MAARAEARPHDRVVDRLAHQELLRALAGLVVVVDHRVVGGLEAIVFLGFAADGQRGIQHLALVAGVGAFVLAGIEHVEGIAGLHLALEVDVVGIDADHVLDDVRRHLVAQRGLVDALIEPHPAAVVIIVVAAVGGLGDGVHALHVDGDIFAEIGQRGDGFDVGIVGDDHPVGLQPLAGARRRHQDAELLAFLQPAVAAAGAERGGDGFRLLRRRALVAQDRGDAVALLDDVDAFAGWIAAGDLILGLRQQRDVFRNHPGLKAGIGVGGRALGGIGQLDVRLRAADVGGGVGERGVAHAAVAAPVRGIAHPHQDIVERRPPRRSSPSAGRRQVLGDERNLGIGLGGVVGGTGIVGGRRRRRCRHRSACAGR